MHPQGGVFHFGNTITETTFTDGEDTVTDSLVSEFEGLVDKFGNPTTYRDNTLTWDGRQMASYNGIQYTYDVAGNITKEWLNGEQMLLGMDTLFCLLYMRGLGNVRISLLSCWREVSIEKMV